MFFMLPIPSELFAWRCKENATSHKFLASTAEGRFWEEWTIPAALLDLLDQRIQAGIIVEEILVRAVADLEIQGVSLF